MSEKQMHRKRWQAKVCFAYDMGEWLRKEPPMWKIFSWHSWKKERPRFEDYVDE